MITEVEPGIYELNGKRYQFYNEWECEIHGESDGIWQEKTESIRHVPNCISCGGNSRVYAVLTPVNRDSAPMIVRID